MLAGIVEMLLGRLLEVGMTSFAMEIWAYTKDLCPS